MGGKRGETEKHRNGENRQCSKPNRQKEGNGMKKETRGGPIPSELRARSESPLTLARIKEIAAQTPRAIVPVRGDCLEAAAVQDGGWVAVDFTRFPAPPRHKNRGGDGSTDLCMCYATFPGTYTPAVMLKEYCGVWGPWQMVGTRYKLGEGSKHRMNCGMEAKEILGVIFASWAPDGTLLWERDPDSFPDKLWATPTIRGGNCGDPIPL